MDTLIVKIMNFAQKLVSADRASLFLVDAKTNQLYARIFDIMGTCIKNGESNGNDTRDFTKEIRYVHTVLIQSYFQIFQSQTVAIWTFTFHKQIRLCEGDFEGEFQTSIANGYFDD